VKRTGRAVVANEAPKMGGLAAEVAATIAEEAHAYLRAPVRRVAGLDAPIPFSLDLEKEILPDKDDVHDAVRTVMEYDVVRMVEV